MGTIKLGLGIFLIVGAVYVCAELAPPYFSNYQFEDAIKNEATMATYSTKSEDAIRDAVFKKAQDLQIPVSKDDIKVHRVGAQGTGSITIEAHYLVHIDFPGYPVDLHFDPTTKNQGAF
ncbi:MAG TPA: hypothetical protein VMT28_02925 [Terriglobales bacterium]|jgi:hypothetical protein|nr:hypothetical protein [Terriglobales bacterium]